MLFLQIFYHFKVIFYIKKSIKSYINFYKIFKKYEKKAKKSIFWVSLKNTVLEGFV